MADASHIATCRYSHKELLARIIAVKDKYKRLVILDAHRPIADVVTDADNARAVNVVIFGTGQYKAAYLEPRPLAQGCLVDDDACRVFVIKVASLIDSDAHGLHEVVINENGAVVHGVAVESGIDQVVAVGSS